MSATTSRTTAGLGPRPVSRPGDKGGAGRSRSRSRRAATAPDAGAQDDRESADQPAAKLRRDRRRRHDAERGRAGLRHLIGAEPADTSPGRARGSDAVHARRPPAGVESTRRGAPPVRAPDARSPRRGRPGGERARHFRSGPGRDRPDFADTLLAGALRASPNGTKEVACLRASRRTDELFEHAGAPAARHHRRVRRVRRPARVRTTPMNWYGDPDLTRQDVVPLAVLERPCRFREAAIREPRIGHPLPDRARDTEPVDATRGCRGAPRKSRAARISFPPASRHCRPDCCLRCPPSRASSPRRTALDARSTRLSELISEIRAHPPDIASSHAVLGRLNIAANNTH